jgi:hypothetical protein
MKNSKPFHSIVNSFTRNDNRNNTTRTKISILDSISKLKNKELRENLRAEKDPFLFEFYDGFTLPYCNTSCLT